jgi:hypothetical protein
MELFTTGLITNNMFSSCHFLLIALKFKIIWKVKTSERTLNLTPLWFGYNPESMEWSFKHKRQLKSLTSIMESLLSLTLNKWILRRSTKY